MLVGLVPPSGGLGVAWSIGGVEGTVARVSSWAVVVGSIGECGVSDRIRAGRSWMF